MEIFGTFTLHSTWPNSPKHGDAGKNSKTYRAKPCNNYYSQRGRPAVPMKSQTRKLLEVSLGLGKYLQRSRGSFIDM